MGLRHEQPPAIGTDPLNIASDVAVLVLAILKRAALICEGEGSEEDTPHRIAGEDDADIALRAAELAEALKCFLRSDAAVEARIGDIVQIAGVSRSQLDHSAAVHAVRDSRTGERGIRL